MFTTIGDWWRTRNVERNRRELILRYVSTGSMNWSTSRIENYVESGEDAH